MNKIKKYFGIMPVIFFILFILPGCDFKVEEFVPPTGIKIMADNVPLVDNFLFFRMGNNEKSLYASIAGGQDVSIAWEIASGAEKIVLLKNHGTKVSIKALEEGDARIKITAENSHGKIEQLIDILVGGDNAREWIFRIYSNNGINGLSEVIDKERAFILYNEDKIINFVPVNETGLSFTVTNSDPSIASAVMVNDDTCLISGGILRGNAPITVTATNIYGQSFEKTFTARVVSGLPMAPLFWNREMKPAITLTGGQEGSVFAVPDSHYFFRASTNTVKASEDGNFILGGTLQILIIGSGNGMGGENPGGPYTGASRHIPGQLNLSNDATYRFTMYYTDLVNGGGWARIAINNNSSSAGMCILGGAGTFREYSNLNNLASASAEPGKLVIEINFARHYASNPGNWSLKDAFISIQTIDGNSITVSGISLEELE